MDFDKRIFHYPGDFRKWVTDQPDDSVIGYANRADSCPLTNYAKARFPEIDLTVDMGFIFVYGHKYHTHITERFATEPWMNKFMSIVDERFGVEAVCREGVLTALRETLA